MTDQAWEMIRQMLEDIRTDTGEIRKEVKAINSRTQKNEIEIVRVKTTARTIYLIGGALIIIVPLIVKIAF